MTVQTGFQSLNTTGQLIKKEKSKTELDMQTFTHTFIQKKMSVHKCDPVCEYPAKVIFFYRKSLIVTEHVE